MEYKDIRIVIAVIGPKGCGKDTIADFAIKELNAGGKIATAGPLKQICKKVFHLTDSHLNEFKDMPFVKPIEFKNFQVRELLDFMRENIPYDVLPLEKFKPGKIGVQRFSGRFFKTPRELLQWVGTEFMQSFYQDFHSYTAYKNLLETKGTWFITDMRFQHEEKIARKLFNLFYVIRIVGRNEVPDGQEEHLSEKDWKNISIFDTIDNSKEGLSFFYENAVKSFQKVKEDVEIRIRDNPKLIEKQIIKDSVKPISRFVYEPRHIAEKVGVIDLDDISELV